MNYELLSDGQEKRERRRPYSEEEQEAFRARFVEKKMAEESEVEMFALVRAEYKERIDALKHESKEMLTALRLGYATEQVMCWRVPDHERGVMEFISVATGEVIDERRLFPDEKQQIIPFQIQREA